MLFGVISLFAGHLLKLGTIRVSQKAIAFERGSVYKFF
jgi:hypothetical protein